MTELLAPAGNMQALRAAVSSGCDAVYLGLERFGARAYSDNFTIESITEAVAYAHLRDVKIYVTMNTIVFQDEIEDMQAQLQQLNDIGVDGVIVQDLAVFEYARDRFVDMQVHCSTQMGVDDLEGTMLFKEMGADRVVMAREVELAEVKRIRRAAGIPIEVFVHGALCVSYSGNCLMSGLIGYRSGNRGRCVGSCRKQYELLDRKSGMSYGKGYLLSMKDLNTIEHIEELKSIDSLKIEGRMKEPAYVANVVARYRRALDGTAGQQDRKALQKTFNRTYTAGYMFGEDAGNITNISRPNNFGYEIGRVKGTFKGMYELTLTSPLHQNDIIRIDHENEDVNLSVARLYDKDGKLINKAQRSCLIKIKERLSPGDIVYKTKDYLFYKELEAAAGGEPRRFALNLRVYAYPGAALVIDAKGFGLQYLYESKEILQEALTNPTTHEQVVKQLARLGDTVFTLGNVELETYNAFIPAKLLNSARRKIVRELCTAKIAKTARRTRPESPHEAISFEPQEAYLTASVVTQEQYETCKACGIKNIYFDNIIRRNQNIYEDMDGELLLGGYDGIYRYRHSNQFVTDYSLNVVNAQSCRCLYELGAKRVTLSYEMNRRQIQELIAAYEAANGGHPALEMIVYGRAPLLFTKYCPLKKMGQCGECHKHSYELKDEYGSFPIMTHSDCSTTILNGKVLNLLDEMPAIGGIEAFRLNFTIESAAEVKRVIRIAQRKLAGEETGSAFDQRTDTRGHFNKEIL